MEPNPEAYSMLLLKKKLTQVGLTVVSLIFYLYFLSVMQTKKDTIFVNLTHVVLSVVETQYLRRFKQKN